MDGYTEAPGVLDTVVPLAHVDVAEAGQAAKTRRQLEARIQSVNSSTFDIMDLLHEVKTKKFYIPKFDTFGSYLRTLSLKVSKAYYLIKIKETMNAVPMERADYEPLGVAKLRVIASVDAVDKHGIPQPTVLAFVKTLLAEAPNKTAEELKAMVDLFQGNVGDEAFEWFNIKIKKSAKAIVLQAFDLVKAQIGSVSQDAEGKSKDASDGACLEKMAMDYVSDPNNAPDVEMMGVDVAYVNEVTLEPQTIEGEGTMGEIENEDKSPSGFAPDPETEYEGVDVV